MAGQVSWEGGDLRENFEIMAGATVTGRVDGATRRQVGGSLVNNGTLRWDNTGVLQGGNGSVLTNQALIEARQTASFEWIFGGRPTLTNEAGGTIRATHNAVLTLGSYALTSNGGRCVADAGSAIRYTGDASRFNDGTRFVGEHQMLGQARFVGTLQSDGLRLVGGTQSGGGGSPGSSGRFAGQVFWEGGDLRENFEIMAGATMTGTGASAKRQVGGSITNNGTFNWATGATLQGGNGSQFTNNGRFDMMADAAVAWIFGGQPHFANNGLVIKTAGAGAGDLSSLALSNNGTIDVRSGSISLPTNFVNAGTLKGTGAFNVAGTLFNNGHVAPGTSPGTLTLNGSYNQGAAGVFDVELEGVASHDLLLVNGNAALNGALALSCFGNRSLAVGAEVVILDATGSLTGEFVPGLALSGFGSGAFDVVYDRVGARVLLQVTEAVTPAVPEPGTYALMAAGLAAVGLLARRRRVLPR